MRDVVCCSHNPCPDRPRRRLARFEVRPWACPQCHRYWTTRRTDAGDGSSWWWQWTPLTPAPTQENPPAPRLASSIVVDHLAGGAFIDGEPFAYYLAETGPRVEADEITTVWLPVLCEDCSVRGSTRTLNHEAQDAEPRRLWRAIRALGRALRATRARARGALDRFARGPVAPLLIVDAVFAKEGRDELRR